jgi:predicted O-linked N-acetylglucosamine transferase (SPINDLY family)
MDTIEMMERAMAAYQDGRDDEAESLCQQVIGLEDDNPDAPYVLGMIAYRRKDLESSERYLRRSIELENGAYWIHAALAEVLMARGNPEAAATALREAARLKPDSPEIANAIAIMIQQYGSPADQAAAWHRVVEVAPQNAAALANLGRALLQTGKLPEGTEMFHKALALDPNLFEAHHGLAVALANQRQPREAIEHAQRAVAIRPESPLGQHALAVAHGALGQLDEAIDDLHRAVELEPTFKDAHDRLNVLLAATGDLPGSMQAMQKVLQIFPHEPAALSNMLTAMNYLPDLSPQQVFEAHRRWGQTYADPLGQQARRHANTNEPHRRLRIGYVSPDFYRHPIAHFVRAIFANHHQDKYEVIAFSDVPKPDDVTRDLEKLASKWIPTVNRNNAQFPELVRFEGIDVLVDLTGHAGRHRLGAFAARAAPVQISYLGYCNTTGMEAMDWIVGDEITDPTDHTQPYVEKVLRLPGSFCCYTPPPDAPAVNELPALSGRPITFGAFHALRKLNDRVLDLWARLLREVPEARLLFWRTYLTPRVEQRLRDALGQRGINAGRLEFRSHVPESRNFLSVYHEVDLALDAFPWSGHTTSCEALWMGVPLVTLRGRTHCGRLAASMLTAAGFGQFVANSEDQYVQIARDLAGDVQRLAELRRTMRDKTAVSALCDGGKFIVNWERAIRDAWRTWCQAKRTYE